MMKLNPSLDQCEIIDYELGDTKEYDGSIEMVLRALSLTIPHTRAQWYYTTVSGNVIDESYVVCDYCLPNIDVSGYMYAKQPDWCESTMICSGCKKIILGHHSDGWMRTTTWMRLAFDASDLYDEFGMRDGVDEDNVIPKIHHTSVVLAMRLME